MFKSKEAAQVVIFYSAAGPQQYGFLLICLLQDQMTVFNYYKCILFYFVPFLCWLLVVTVFRQYIPGDHDITFHYYSCYFC